MQNLSALLLCVSMTIVIFPVLTIGEEIMTRVGGTAELPCGIADRSVKWYRPDGEEIKIDGTKYTIDVVNGTLKVSKVGEADVGTYRCQTASGNETIEVHSAPYVKPLDKSVNLVFGDQLELVCNAWGYPPPKVTWIKNSEKENGQISANDRTSFGFEGKVENAKLNITSVTYDDYGIYICNATNEHGSTQSSTKVRVKDKLAPLWPFIGICAEVIILFVIIVIYERRRSKQNYDEDVKEGNLTNSNDHQEKEKVRLRK